MAAAQSPVSENIENVLNSNSSTASLAGDVKRKLNWMSDRAVKAGAKARLLKKMLDNKVGTKTVEAMAASKVAERDNAEGDMKDHRRRGDFSSKTDKEDGCVRDVNMVKYLSVINPSSMLDN